MDLTAVLAGVGAILTAAGGTVLVVREFRRRDHAAANSEIQMLANDLHVCREQLVNQSRHVFTMRQQLVDNGLDVPEVDEPKIEGER